MQNNVTFTWFLFCAWLKKKQRTKKENVHSQVQALQVRGLNVVKTTVRVHGQALERKRRMVTPHKLKKTFKLANVTKR